MTIDSDLLSKAKHVYSNGKFLLKAREYHPHEDTPHENENERIVMEYIRGKYPEFRGGPEKAAFFLLSLAHN